MYLTTFLKKHKDNWREILSSSPYNLIIKDGVGEYEGLTLFKYNQLESNLSYQLVQDCRGIIVDIEDNFKVISYPFRKFFNYGERYASNIDWGTARVQQKVDGSIIKVAYWERKNKWVISTNGCINAFDVDATSISDTFMDDVSVNFGKLFMEAFNKNHYLFDKLNKNCTYMFELVSPYTKVVIDYPETDIYHIGTRDNRTFKEIDVDIGIKKPHEYSLHSLDAVLSAANALNINDDKIIEDEGFVVVDGKWRRVKIKSPLYLSAHYLKGNKLSFNRCLDIIMHNEEDEYLSYFPEQKGAFDAVHDTIEKIEHLLTSGWVWLTSICDISNRKAVSEILMGKNGPKWKWASYYFKKIDYPNISPHQYLFGGYRFYDNRTNEWKETLPLPGLNSKLKSYYESREDFTTWKY